jgi:Fe-S oxidoreductase
MSDYIETENLKHAKKTMMTCTYCGFCKSVCPVFEGIGWESSVARGRMILAYGLLQKDIPADESVIENLFQCTTCRDCERRCPSNIEVVDVVERARKDLVAAGKMLPTETRTAKRPAFRRPSAGSRKGPSWAISSDVRRPTAVRARRPPPSRSSIN